MTNMKWGLKSKVNITKKKPKTKHTTPILKRNLSNWIIRETKIRAWK